MMRHCLLNGNAYAVIEWGRDGSQITASLCAGVCYRNALAHTKTANIPSPNPVQETVRTYLQEEVLHLVIPRMMVFWGVPRHDLPGGAGAGLAQQRHGASIMKDGMMAAGLSRQVNGWTA